MNGGKSLISKRVADNDATSSHLLPIDVSKTATRREMFEKPPLAAAAATITTVAAPGATAASGAAAAPDATAVHRHRCGSILQRRATISFDQDRRRNPQARRLHPPRDDTEQ